jgi:hypothetical protein
MGAKPQAQNDLIEKWNQGNLISIYYGHGGTNQLADEKFLTDEGVSQLTGFPTIFLAFSCVVGRIDRINYESMTEKLLWNSKGGAIATFSAMRESFSRSNDSLAFYFLGSLFKAGNVTLGEAVRQAKQKLNTSYFIRHNAERYQLYGEPVLQVPSSSFNISVDQPIDTLKALDKIKISGTASVSSGELILRVEEQKKQKIYAWDIIGNDGVNELEENTFVPGRLLYEEKLPIVNGRFVSEWISPKKLSFGDTNATLSLYGFQAGTASSARFLQNGINIWGTSAYADSIVDKSPPTIKALSCFARSKQVEFGPNITLPKAGCLAFLVEDSTGIDFVENPDEGVSIAVKGIQVPTHPSFIEQNGKRALFRYYFPDTVGTFAVNVRASDILGNVQEQEWGVTIASSANTLVSRVYSIPNPMKSYTKFHFQQNATGYAFIKIFNQRGKLVRLLDPVEPGITKWDGRDHWGNILANGLYYYTLTLISEGKRSHQRQKLVISR